MNQEWIDRLADKIIVLLHQNDIVVEASGRHVHLSKADKEALFGKDYTLQKKSDLSQPGQFACQERVALQGPKGTIENVIVLGPERPETQVEISATDALRLGIDVPVRMSGQTAGTPGATLTGPQGELRVSRGVMVAKRHLHMTAEDGARFGIADGDEVSVTVPGERAVTFHNVAVRVSSSFATCLHIDFDEANACGYHKGMTCTVHKAFPTEKPPAFKAGPCADSGGSSGIMTLPVAGEADRAERSRCTGDSGLCRPPAKMCRLRDADTDKQSPGACKQASGRMNRTLDLTGRKLIHERELIETCTAGITSLRIAQNAIVTHLAVDYLKNNGIAVFREGEADG